jgi:hypothetical protein
VSAAPSRLDDLLALLPGTVRRGHAPSVRAGEKECLSTGIAALDRTLGGGFPRGRLSELRGRGSAGITSLLHRLAACTTTAGELVAWIDAPDAFDPESAASSGIALDRLLWVRPRDALAAFAATEQILVLGGFALVVVDVDGQDPPRARRPAPAHVASAQRERRWTGAQQNKIWLRLARAATRSTSALVAFGRGPDGAGSAAAVRHELAPARVLWDRSGDAPALLDGLHAKVVVKRNRGLHGEQALAVALD